MNKTEAMLAVRERVGALVAHLQAEGAPAAPGPMGDKARDLHERYLPTLRDFAAGRVDYLTMDRLHLALEAMTAAAVAISDRALFECAAMAAHDALPLCSPNCRAMVQRSDMSFFQSLA